MHQLYSINVKYNAVILYLLRNIGVYSHFHQYYSYIMTTILNEGRKPGKIKQTHWLSPLPWVGVLKLTLI